MTITLKIPKLSPKKGDGCHDLTFSSIQLRDNNGKFIDCMKIDKEMIDVIGDAIKNGYEMTLKLPNNWNPDALSERNRAKLDVALVKDLEKERLEAEKQASKPKPMVQERLVVVKDIPKRFISRDDSMSRLFG